MSLITCSIIKQYMWYYHKYKKYEDCKFIIVLYFDSSQLHYVIYENITPKQLQYEKQNYSSYPAEYNYDNNTYHIFSFSHQNKSNTIETLRKYYKIKYIDVDENKLWTEKKEYTECLKIPNSITHFKNKLTSAITNIFFEQIVITEPQHESNNNISINENKTQHIHLNQSDKVSQVNKVIQEHKTNNGDFSNHINSKPKMNVFGQTSFNNNTDSLQLVINELIQAKPRVVIHKTGQKMSPNKNISNQFSTTYAINNKNTEHSNNSRTSQDKNQNIIQKLHQQDDDFDDNMILYEEIDTVTSKSTIKTESEKVLRTSKIELVDEFVKLSQKSYINTNVANVTEEIVHINKPIDINSRVKLSNDSMINENLTDSRFSKKLKFKKTIA